MPETQKQLLQDVDILRLLSPVPKSEKSVAAAIEYANMALVNVLCAQAALVSARVRRAQRAEDDKKKMW